jgi:hypothetical protein
LLGPRRLEQTLPRRIPGRTARRFVALLGLQHQRLTEQPLRFGIVGIARHRLAQLADRFVELTEVQVDRAKL